MEVDGMNKHPTCQGCKYNTPKVQGGLGRLCNGFTQPARCPEWAINEYNNHHTHTLGYPFKMSYVSAYMRGEIT